MDSVAFVCTTFFLAVGLYWLVSMFRATDEKRKRDVTDVTFGSIDGEKVKDTYNKYASFFSNPSEIKKDEKVPKFVDVFYDLVTDMYEYLWGQSFHFSPSIPGKSKTENAIIHEEMAVDLINVKPGQKIIDVGCGVGGPMRAIASHSGCNVVGITINGYQVSRAKAYNQKAGMEKQCQVVCGNFLEMPFEDESFDGAYSIDATCHAPKLEDVYREIFRVLKPGSMYVSYEWVTTDLYRAQNQKHVDIIQGIERGNALPGLRSYTDIAETAKKVGFEVVKEKDLAKPPANPWWSRLQKGRFNIWRRHMLVVVLEKLGIVAKGTVDVQDMLLESVGHLAKGGETGIFTPMHMILCKKPENTQQS